MNSYLHATGCQTATVFISDKRIYIHREENKEKKYKNTETNYTDEATKSRIIQFKHAYLGEYNQKTLQQH